MTVSGLRTPGKAAGVIDLANDDDEENLRKAMSLSMQSSDVPPLYQEEHDKHWALVPVVKVPRPLPSLEIKIKLRPNPSEPL